ncbi:MAG: ABC transporter permease [Acidimicrobiia bacterium]
MLTYSIRRFLVAIPVVLVATFVMFSAVRLTFDACEKFATSRDRTAYPRCRERLGLDDPLPVQYGRWFKDFAHGDWGKSDVAGDDVRTTIMSGLGITTQLIVWGVLISAVVAISIGVYSATHQYSKLDYTFTGLSYFGLSMPPFYFGMLAIVFIGVGLFGTGVKPFDFVGLHTGNSSGIDVDYARHLVLPVLVLTIQIIAEWSRYMRASMLDSLGSEYIRTARAKGVPERRVIWRHGVRNSLIPLVSVMAIDIGALFGGLVITEYLFSIKGMGYYFVDRLERGDATFLAAWVVVTALFVIAFNLIADLLYGVLDPRVRLQ